MKYRTGYSLVLAGLIALCVALSPALSQPADTLFVSKLLEPNGSFTGSVEGPCVDSLGNLYFVNYRPGGTIGKIAPDRKHSLFVTLPAGSTGNGARFNGKDFKYMFVADNGAKKLLKVNMQTLQVTTMASNPKWNFPNDLAVGELGIWYMTDSDFGKNTGKIWKIDSSGVVTLVDSLTGSSNGIEMSPDEKTLYECESVSQGTNDRNIFAYDISGTGELSNKRKFIGLPGYNLDGMRCDTAGNLYITRQQKATIAIVSPQGQLIREVDLIGKDPRNVAFGGPDGRTLYVMNAGIQSVEYFRVEIPGREWWMWKKRQATKTAPFIIAARPSAIRTNYTGRGRIKILFPTDFPSPGTVELFSFNGKSLAAFPLNVVPRELSFPAPHAGSYIMRVRGHKGSKTEETFSEIAKVTSK